jgi:hypothetical protein
MAALSITDHPMEHWHRHQITHSSGPYANPHTIDPICLTAVDFSAVLVTVKAKTITDIPMKLTVKNHCNNGSVATVNIIAFDDLAPGSDSSGPDPSPILEAFSSHEEQIVEIEGGTSYAEVMQVLGVPAPLVPHGTPTSAAPTASIVSRALVKAPLLPLVSGSPVLTKPSNVVIKLWMCFFDISVSGSNGERCLSPTAMVRLG